MHSECDVQPMVTFPAVGHHCPLITTGLYCLTTEAYTVNNLPKVYYVKEEWPGIKPAMCESRVQHANHRERKYPDTTGTVLKY